jgi:hypothetical protein
MAWLIGGVWCRGSYVIVVYCVTAAQLDSLYLAAAISIVPQALD